MSKDTHVEAQYTFDAPQSMCLIFLVVNQTLLLYYVITRQQMHNLCTHTVKLHQIMLTRYTKIADLGSRVSLKPLACWGYGFESRQGYGNMSLVNVVYCQIERLTRRADHSL